MRLALTPGFGPDRAADGITDALMYAWRHWEKVLEMENPHGYLYRIARRRAQRRPRREPVAPAIRAVAEPAVEPGLERALDRLSPMQRTVTVLVEGFEWRQSEVAELLGISHSSVRRHLDRGLGKLRDALGVDDE